MIGLGPPWDESHGLSSTFAAPKSIQKLRCPGERGRKRIGLDPPIEQCSTAMMKQILTLIVALFLFSCASTPGHIQPGQISRISVGMTRQEVISTIGPPESASAGKGEETLFYVEERPWWQWARIRVRIVEGKVTEFGEMPK